MLYRKACLYMKKILLAVMILALTSCADKKTFTKSDGSTFTAEPYGWANYQTKKIEGVTYECSLENVVWGIIGCETIIIPVWLSGWELFEPVSYTEPEINSERK